jgi:hypothetical protein
MPVICRHIFGLKRPNMQFIYSRALVEGMLTLVETYSRNFLKPRVCRAGRPAKAEESCPIVSPPLRGPNNCTISSSPNGAGTCLLLYLVGLRPSSSAAFPTSGRLTVGSAVEGAKTQRAILLRHVSGTARHAIASTVVTLLLTNTTNRFVTECSLLRYFNSLSRSVVVVDYCSDY